MAAIKVVITAVPDMAVTQVIPREPARVAAILVTRALNAVAPTQAMRVFASNAACLCCRINVPVAVQRYKLAPSSAASAASLNSNATPRIRVVFN